jgi:hypothetical protein
MRVELVVTESVAGDNWQLSAAAQSGLYSIFFVVLHGLEHLIFVFFPSIP